MQINPFTLQFCKEHEHLESEYRSAHFDNSLTIQRISILLFILLYFIFGVLDAFVAPEKKYTFWIIRYLFVCPYSLVILFVAHTNFFRKHDSFFISIMLVSGGIGINLMILFANPPVAYTYFAGLILVIIGINVFLRIRFTWAFASSLIVLAFYEIIAVYINTPSSVFISNNFFFLSVLLICVISGYFRERLFRGNFFLNYMLDKEKETVANKNKELHKRIRDQHRAEEALIEKNLEIENIVVERTFELHKSKEKYRELIEHLNDMIFVMDDTGKFTYVSPVVMRLLGFEVSEVQGKKINEFIHIDDIDHINHLLYKETNSDNNSTEFRFRSKSGEFRWVTISTRNDNDAALKTTIRGVLRDITNERKLEMQLRQAHKMEAIGTLAGGIAHDFNNILFSIIGNTELILTDLPDNSPLSPQINGIYQSSLRAKELVRQILTFSRSQSKELQLIKVQPLLKEALDLLRATIPSTINIIHDIEEVCGPVMADPTHIHQIIINLVTNSFHAMEQNGGTLEVSFRQIEFTDSNKSDHDIETGLYAELTVSDNGEGIDKDRLEKIFDPFFTTKEQGKGTGMGLSVVHGIVQSMEGTIKVESEPEIGTEFKIYFPVSKKNFPDPSKPIETELTGGNERILLVDDDEEILEMEEQILNYLGYKVTTALNSHDAVDIFRDDPEKFDLVITDMAMPLMSGEKLAKKLLNIRSDIPIILCTGFSEIMSEEMAAEYGIQGFLTKPVSMKDLADKIRKLLDQA
jgi:PAS domain S-box-containing protein